MAIVVIATTIHPKRELGWPCISFQSAAKMAMIYATFSRPGVLRVYYRAHRALRFP